VLQKYLAILNRCLSGIHVRFYLLIKASPFFLRDELIFCSLSLVDLPANFSVWAASPEASWLHGHFVWAHWDVNEMKADPEIQKQLEEDRGYLKIGVQGLRSIQVAEFLNDQN
jgi:hypothetical protein